MPQEVIRVPNLIDDPRIHVFRRKFSQMEVDAYAILTQQYAILCDTLLCPEDIEEVVGLLGNELVGRKLLIVNSHADWDHAWGNCYFTGERVAPIIAHDYCRVRLQSAEGHQKLVEYQQRDERFRNVVLTPPTITFANKLVIRDDDLTVELLSAPGHHLDHIAAWIPELALLLAFDAIEMPLPLLGDAEGVPAMFTTLEQFEALSPRHALCSHGNTTSPALVSENLNYFRLVEFKCQEWLNNHPGQQPTDADFEEAATLINYPFEQVVASVIRATDAPNAIDETFYSWAHNMNIRYMMQYLRFA